MVLHPATAQHTTAAPSYCLPFVFTINYNEKSRIIEGHIHGTLRGLSTDRPQDPVDRFSAGHRLCELRRTCGRDIRLRYGSGTA